MKPGTIYYYNKMCPNCNISNYHLHIDEIDHKSGVVSFHSMCHSCNYLNVSQASLIRIINSWLHYGQLSELNKSECTCGGTKCNTTHSRWCEIYV